MAKIKTNEQAFKAFLKNADDFTVAVIRAKIVDYAKEILENREQVIADGDKAMISGHLYVRTAEQVVENLGFEKDTKNA